jgi:AcrR family transcriptional regulator
MDAMARVTAESGFGGTSVERVIERAQISRGAFYEVFASLEECFLAMQRHAMGQSITLIAEAFERETTWQDGVTAGLVALLGFLDSEPHLARVCLVETLAAGPLALEQRASELAALDPLVDAGRAQDSHPPAVMAEATVAAVAGILRNRLLAGDAPPFIDLLGSLVSVVTTPYLDAQSVARQIEKATRLAESISQERSSQPPPVTDTEIPRELRDRGAYRMRASLLYVANHPSASNQDVAEGVDMRHLGQMSKLLARLESLGLLSKLAGGPGYSNAWSLTPHGERVSRMLKVYF